MRLALFVNDVMTEEVGYTTNRLAMAAINRGHEAWVIAPTTSSTTKTTRSWRWQDTRLKTNTNRPRSI